MANYNKRIDHEGEHRTAYEKNRKRILATQEICGICGRPVDKSLPNPHPLSPCIDHIIPIKRGGHPSDISNLQLAHFCCNRAKGISMTGDDSKVVDRSVISNRILPLSIDWKNF